MWKKEFEDGSGLAETAVYHGVDLVWTSNPSRTCQSTSGPLCPGSGYLGILQQVSSDLSTAESCKYGSHISLNQLLK